MLKISRIGIQKLNLRGSLWYNTNVKTSDNQPYLGQFSTDLETDFNIGFSKAPQILYK